MHTPDEIGTSPAVTRFVSLCFVEIDGSIARGHQDCIFHYSGRPNMGLQKLSLQPISGICMDANQNRLYGLLRLFYARSRIPLHVTADSLLVYRFSVHSHHLWSICDGAIINDEKRHRAPHRNPFGLVVLDMGYARR